jgi:hypothetical protein
MEAEDTIAGIVQNATGMDTQQKESP